MLNPNIVNNSPSDSGDLGFNGFPISLNYFTALPDPSNLHDPNLTVIFKSLLKKDSITKEKSLNDLIQTFNEPEYDSSLTEDLVIISWIQLYPKLAIDNSRNVRILSHDVQASFLQKVGGKSYSKYFKSTIPIWLHGLYDSDKAVAKACYKSLLESLQGEKANIDKLWSIFSIPIVNYINTSISLENHESLSDQRYTKEADSFAKYERVLNGSLSMLIKIINLINCNELKFSEYDRGQEYIQVILNSEKLWDYLGSAIVTESMNLPLFKTLLVLLKSLFSKTESDELNSFLRNLGDVKSFYKIISKKFIKFVKLKPNTKSPNSDIIYSNIILQFWETLISLTDFSNLSEFDKKQFKIKKNFWELGGSKSFSRLVDYLKLGHCQSEPAYYDNLSKFFEILSTTEIENEEFLNFDDLKDAESIIIKILSKHLKNLPNIDYKSKAVPFILKVYRIFTRKAGDENQGILKVLLYSILDSLSRSTRANEARKKDLIISSLADFLKSKNLDISVLDLMEELNIQIANTSLEEEAKDFSIGKFQFNSSFQDVCDTYVQLLSHLKIEPLTSSLINSIADKVEDSSISKPTTVFRLMGSVVKLNLVDNSTINNFLDIAPSFIEDDFINEPINFLSLYLKSEIKDHVNAKEAINNYYLKLSDNPSKIPKLLDVIEAQLQEEPNSYTEIFEYLTKISNKKNLTSDESKVLFKYTNVAAIADNLITNFCTNEARRLEFIEKVIKYSIRIGEYKSNSHLNSLLLTCWRNISLPFCQNFVALLLEEKNLISTSAFEFLNTSDFQNDFIDMVNCLDSFSLLIEAIFETTCKELENVNKDLLSIANPLEQNIYLIESENSLHLNVSLITFGAFLSTYVRKNSIVIEGSRLALLCGLISEYIHDLIFLKKGSDLGKISTILDIRQSLSDYFLSFFHNCTLDTLLPILNGNKDLENGTDVVKEIFSALNELVSGNKGISYYAARLLKEVLSLLFEKETLQSFENKSIDLNRFVSTPLKLSAILLSSSKFFIKSSKFDRLRNFLSAEIIGVTKESDILTTGLIRLTLTINFFNSEDPYEVIPPHRLMMILNQISKWLESDISYDASFIAIRTQLSRFFIGLLFNSKSLPEKFWEIATQLIIDNLSLSQVEIQHLELNYFTSKLFIIMAKYDQNHSIEIWHEHENAIYDELLEVLINEEIQAQSLLLDNQAVTLNHEMLGRIFRGFKFPKISLKDKKGQFYLLLENSKFEVLQRIAVSILHDIILNEQQDFVVEYELSKSKLGESEQIENSAILPESLIKGIDFHIDDIDMEPHHRVAKYIWSWLLIFDHFKDITHSIRAAYVKQIKENDRIDNLFNFIFEQVNISEGALLKKLTIGDDVSENLIQSYNIQEGYSGEDFNSESRLLLLHLYYLSFKYLGSNVQSWYNGIRDRQLKQQIEKFSIKYVSPLIVSKILDDVIKSKDKLASKDENMSIKVNSVTNEIRSVYIIDEQTMQMVIKVPSSYPLSNVSVEGPLRIGVKENRWKAWLLASQRIITSANGSIMESIELFNRNVNLHFSGFEDCAICYSILHQDHSLPSKVCPTCSNKFHAACLYKWFKSSGASTCPLCRSAFNFRNTRSAAV